MLQVSLASSVRLYVCCYECPSFNLRAWKTVDCDYAKLSKYFENEHSFNTCLVHNLKGYDKTVDCNNA